MKLFAGLPTTDYQDVFRSVGALLDQHELRDVRIWEHGDGLMVQGRPRDDESGNFQSFLLTDEDLESMLAHAYRLRQEAGES